MEQWQGGRGMRNWPLPSGRRPPRTSVWQENERTEGHVPGDRAKGNPEPVVVSVSDICPQEPPRGLMTWWRGRRCLSLSSRWNGKRGHPDPGQERPRGNPYNLHFQCHTSRVHRNLPFHCWESEFWTLSISAVGHCCPFLGPEVCL